MENQQIKLLLNKWEEVHKKLTDINTDDTVPIDFFESFEKEMISFLREFYRLKEEKKNNAKTNEQHLKYNISKENDIPFPAKEEAATKSSENKNANNYPDIQFYFSLNDKFYFLREIFNGNTTKMNQIISILNTKKSLDDTLKYMEKELSWNPEDSIIEQLIKIIEKRFDNKKTWESYS